MNHRKIAAEKIAKTVSGETELPDTGSVTFVELDNGNVCISVTDTEDTISIVIDGDSL